MISKPGLPVPTKRLKLCNFAQVMRIKKLSQRKETLCRSSVSRFKLRAHGKMTEKFRNWRLKLLNLTANSKMLKILSLKSRLHSTKLEKSHTSKWPKQKLLRTSIQYQPSVTGIYVVLVLNAVLSCTTVV